jgi:hypothetical protein
MPNPPSTTPAAIVPGRRIVEPLNIHIPQQSTMTVDVRTSYRDRAEGFVIETHRFGLVVGGLAALVAVVGWGYPILTIGTLLIFGLWYGLVWLVAWLFHRIISPEGLALFNAVMMWRYVNRR